MSCTSTSRCTAAWRHRPAPECRAACASFDHVLHRHQRAEHVGHVGDRNHLGARRQQLLEFVDEEIALVVDRRPFDHRAVALAQEMPRHDVGMVLHDREHDLVARLDPLARERVGDEIDRLGGVAGEDDLFGARRIEERPHLLARALVAFGRGIGEIMQAAMHVGIFRRVGLLDAVEHRLRLLRRRGVVEIDQRLAIDLHAEDREILADAVDVVGAVAHRRMQTSDMRSAPARSEPGHDLLHQRVAQARHARCPRSPRRRRPAPAAPRPRSRECRAPSGRT